jgi:hypothetical protein
VRDRVPEPQKTTGTIIVLYIIIIIIITTRRLPVKNDRKSKAVNT